MTECGYKKCNRHNPYEQGEILAHHFSYNFYKDNDIDVNKITHFLRCFLCDWECKRTRGFWTVARNHADTHDISQVHECSLCSKKFYTLAFLESHFKRGGIERICC